MTVRRSQLPSPQCGATRAAWTCALVLLVGCDPGYQLTGTVRSSSEAPIAGAVAKALCDEPPRPEGRSDAAGNLHGAGLGFFADDCAIEVSAPGYRAERFSVATTCSRRLGGSCVHVDLRAVLAPVGRREP